MLSLVNFLSNYIIDYVAICYARVFIKNTNKLSLVLFMLVITTYISTAISTLSGGCLNQFLVIHWLEGYEWNLCMGSTASQIIFWPPYFMTPTYWPFLLFVVPASMSLQFFLFIFQ